MTGFHREVLRLEAEREAERIADRLRDDVLEVLKRRGAVLGVSGGVDSAVVLALAVRALGPERVVALLLPEAESSPESSELAYQVCRQFQVEPLVEDVSGALRGFDCYGRRDEAVRSLFPDYDDSYRLKITLPSDLLERETLNVFSITVVAPDGQERRKRLGGDQLRQIVAASNFKQRSRAAMLYYHAEQRDYAVLGTPPRNEHDLGFFVRFGDSAMDVKPIAHLYKTQVYQLAEHLEIPEAIRTRPPTSDTYSAGSTQEEFFFRLPHETLDLLWYAKQHDVPIPEVARVMELGEDQVERVFKDLARKEQVARRLHAPPLGAREPRTPEP